MLAEFKLFVVFRSLTFSTPAWWRIIWSPEPFFAFKSPRNPWTTRFSKSSKNPVAMRMSSFLSNNCFRLPVNKHGCQSLKISENANFVSRDRILHFGRRCPGVSPPVRLFWKRWDPGMWLPATQAAQPYLVTVTQLGIYQRSGKV